ncbi:MAG: 6-phosphofructokinase [Acutalibacteraceae bacterium]
MKRRIGILTSGGDCPGLNACIRGVAKASYEKFGDDVEIYGIVDGYTGLINGEYKKMERSDFSGILTRGGTILGTSRQPYKKIQVIGDDNVDKVKNMIENYKKMKLDCLCTLGGNGTHKTANLLSQNGLNIIGLPKTIDNDIYGTEHTFGYQTAVDIGTDVIDRLHTTAASHSRAMVVEIMGNKVGWLALSCAIAGGADAIILPEMPFKYEKIAQAVQHRIDTGHVFSIIVVAEGAYSSKEAKMKRKERIAARGGEATPTSQIVKYIQENTGVETRSAVPGHYLRGGSPCAFDRMLASELGTYVADLIDNEIYGVTVAEKGGIITHNKLSDIAGVSKPVPADHQLIKTAKALGMSFCC